MFPSEVDLQLQRTRSQNAANKMYKKTATET